MRQKFDIESIDKRNPFLTPPDYFESVSKLVFSAIDASEAQSPTIMEKSRSKDGAKVYGMVRRSKRRPWIVWVAAAACICGIVFMVSRQSGSDSNANLASTTSPAVIPLKTSETPSQTSSSKTVSKSYANGSYSLAEHRSSASSSRYQPLKIDASTTPEPGYEKSSFSQPSVVNNPSISSQLAINSNPTQESDIDVDDFDVLDFTDMGISDVYDYLNGEDYF